MKKLYFILIFFLLFGILSVKAQNTKPTPPKNTLPPPSIPKREKSECFSCGKISEIMPQFSGGRKKWDKYLKKNLKYPKEARKADIEGKVFVKFIVEKDGTLNNFKVIGYGCDEEVLRIMQNSPKWIAGTTGGKPVKVQMSMPIIFK